MAKTPNLIAEIEGLHDIITGNNIFYTPEAIAEIESWIKPYPKPLIFHHKDEDGKIVGRIIDVKCIDSVLLPNHKALWFKARVTDENTKQGIRDGTYLTTSVGATGLDVECSICKHKISSGSTCQHKRGKHYRNQLCYWIVKKLVGKELSLVIVPSDNYSRIVRFYDELLIEEEPSKEKGEKNMDLQEALEKINTLEATIQTQAQELDSQKVTLQEFEQVKNKLAETEQALSDETVLREGLESKLSELKLVEKQQIIEEIVVLRESLKLHTISNEALSEKSEIYLQEALKDLRSENEFRKTNAQEDTTMINLKEHLENKEIILKKNNATKFEKSATEVIANLL